VTKPISEGAILHLQHMLADQLRSEASAHNASALFKRGILTKLLKADLWTVDMDALENLLQRSNGVTKS
jgi:hypothetical protein